MGWRGWTSLNTGWTPGYDTHKKEAVPKKKILFVTEKYNGDIKQGQKNTFFILLRKPRAQARARSPGPGPGPAKKSEKS